MKNTTITAVAAILMIILIGCGAKPAAETGTTTNITEATAAEPSVCDKECFNRLANECQTISITVDETYGLMNYSAENCVFTKTVIKLSDTESQQIRNVFRMKSLACNYTKGEFYTGWTDSLVDGLEKCDGKLKSLIVDMLTFV